MATETPATPGYLQYQEPAKAASGSTMGTLAYVLSLIILFIGVIALAYLTSRFIAAKMGGGRTRRGHRHWQHPHAGSRQGRSERHRRNEKNRESLNKKEIQKMD